MLTKNNDVSFLGRYDHEKDNLPNIH
jgi:hypothetical protein